MGLKCSTCTNKRFVRIKKSLICREKAQSSYKSFNAKTNDNINPTFSIEETNTTITVPSKFITINDFITRWFSWKDKFLIYLKNHANDNTQTWGIMLLDFMGPVGEEIHRTFRFYDDKPEEDVEVLIKKFDIYCLYGNRKKEDNENIDAYINKLKYDTIIRNYPDPMSIIKEKIIQDIKTQRFLGEAASFVKRRDKNLISYLRSLNIDDVILFWKQCENLMPQKRPKDSISQQDCKVAVPPKNCGKPLQKSSICTEETQSSNKSSNAKKNDNINRTFLRKKGNTTITVPSKFITKDDFVTRWFSWKDEFLTYLKNIDPADKQTWGTKLLNFMGPIGEQIHSTFHFYDDKPEDDMDVLIKKFDIYCLYGNMKKKDNEDIDIYITKLKLATLTQNYPDPVSIMKEKIIQDIKTQRFVGEAAFFVKRREKNLISYLRSLDINDVILFWKQCENLMPQKRPKDSIPQQDCKDSIPPKNSGKPLQKSSICTEETQLSNKSSNTEKNDNINPTFLRKNNDTTITVPSKFITKDDFVTRWFSWKDEFLIYLKNIDPADKQTWGTKLLNFMGSIGEQIHSTFRFYDDKPEDDIDVLIKKFDIYCLYGNMKKKDNEDIDVYITKLKLATLTQNYPDPMSIMKEKIIQDIKTQRFVGEAASFIKHRDRNLISYLRSLDINDVIRFWKQCENLMLQKHSENLTSQNDYKDTISQENSDNALQKTVICTEEERSSYKSFNAEKNCTINPTFPEKNNDTIIVSFKFTTLNDFDTKWFSWKNEFLNYLKNIDATDANQQTWGIMLLNLMGPIGEQIHSTFRFYDDKPEEDIDVLIKKFDIYCLYGNKKKKDNEDIDMYVNKLKLATLVRKYPNPISIIKEKIIQDIKTQQFLGEAASFVKRQEKNLIPYLRSLDINDVILFWKQCENLMPQKRPEDSISQQDCKVSGSPKNSGKPLQKSSICTEEIQSSNKSCNAEKNDNINPTFLRKNNDTTITVQSKFITKDDFVTRWFSWKDEFLTYLKNIDPADKQTWGTKLLNFMGPIGEQIHSTFHFYDDKPEDDMDVLIKKFDIYCLYRNIKKKDNEDIDIYITKLKFATLTQNYPDPMSIMKEKIIQDIKTQRFVGEAASFVKRQEKNLISYLRSLDISDVIFFWKQCENLMAQKCPKDSIPQDCKDSIPPKNSEKLLQKSSICTEETQLSNKSSNAEKNDINSTLPIKNNDTIITAPSKFITLNDFDTTWFSWKDEFLIYLKNIDSAEANQQTWGIMLLNLMGPIGKQIHSTFRFYDDKPEEDMDVLIKKFDIYCLYGTRKKKENEDIDIYINKLKNLKMYWGSNLSDAEFVAADEIEELEKSNKDEEEDNCI